MIVRRLKLCWGDISDRLEQPPMIEPVDPFERGVFDRFQMTPRAAAMNHLGLVETDYGLGERVIVGISDAAHRRFGAGFGQSLRVANRQVLAATITVMD